MFESDTRVESPNVHNQRSLAKRPLAKRPLGLERERQRRRVLDARVGCASSDMTSAAKWVRQGKPGFRFHACLPPAFLHSQASCDSASTTGLIHRPQFYRVNVSCIPRSGLARLICLDFGTIAALTHRNTIRKRYVRHSQRKSHFPKRYGHVGIAPTSVAIYSFYEEDSFTY